jgi:arsenate reductase/ArsR family transcriptional regulator
MIVDRLDQATAVARALAHPARLRIVAMLRSGELCVCQVTAVLGLAPSTVSAHLKELKNAGVVTERRDGRWVYLALAQDGAVPTWIECALVHTAGADQVAADARLVAELRRLSVEDLCRFGLERAQQRAEDSSEVTS